MKRNKNLEFDSNRYTLDMINSMLDLLTVTSEHWADSRPELKLTIPAAIYDTIYAQSKAWSTSSTSGALVVENSVGRVRVYRGE